MIENNTIQQTGVKRRSGRYAYGSGEDPYQHESWTFLSKYDGYRAQGMSEVEIAKKMNMSTGQLRSEVTNANRIRRQTQANAVKTMREDGKSWEEISERLGISTRNAQYMAKADYGVKIKQIDNTMETLKEQVAKNKYLDVGKGVENQLGVSRQKLDAAIAQLEKETGEKYYTHTVWVKDLNDPTKGTAIKVLSKEPNYEEVFKNRSEIRTPTAWSDDGGLNFKHIEDPKNLSWDKVAIRYGDKGGVDKDGIIEIRRGAEGFDMGDSNYAQVRIAVDGTHYLKGMAVYSDNMPKGKDVIFNTNKQSGTPKEKVLKELKDDKFNPFGATITRQKGYLNIVNEEKAWSDWSAGLASQFLAKQPIKLVNERLTATFNNVKKDHDSIMSIENPVVKKYLLEKFADGCDTKASKLKADGIPGEMANVIIPVPSLKPNEVYAPNYRNGDTVVLVRYPHAGRFELVEAKVNNKVKEGKSTLGNAIDGIGLHPTQAQKLSGADFDGDTVYVLPNNDKRIKTEPMLKELRTFDPNSYTVDHPTISAKYKQKQMGIVTNLIADMTVQGAPKSDIVKAVKHSMVIIDAEKHHLDWKQSEIDNDIKYLHEKYQGKKTGGASTLLTRAKSPVNVDKNGNIVKEKTRKAVNPKTGKEFNEHYFVDADGNEVKKSQVRTRYRMDVTADARDLISTKNTAVEQHYANYANKLKALKNQSLKEADTIQMPKVDPVAKRKYANEVASLNKKLNDAQANAPQERQVKLQAEKYFIETGGYNRDKDSRKKYATQVTDASREMVVGKKSAGRLEITDKEWEAINNNAISPTKTVRILTYADMDAVREKATPYESRVLTSNKAARARSMRANGKTWAEISEALGVSPEQIRRSINVT